MRCFTLNDHVDAGVIRSEGVGRDTGEKSAVRSLRPPDAEVRHHTSRQDLFADRVSRVGLGFEALVVHVPDYTDGLRR